jgi:hypothetical protein
LDLLLYSGSVALPVVAGPFFGLEHRDQGRAAEVAFAVVDQL